MLPRSLWVSSFIMSIWRALFPWCPPFPLTPLPKGFASSSKGFPRPWWRNLMKASHLGLTVQGLSLSLHLLGCGPLYLFSSAAGGKVLWWWLSKALIECHEESLYCYVLLVEQWYWVPPSSLGYLVSGSWSLGQCWRLIDLKFNHTLVGFSHKSVPLLYQRIVQVGHSCRAKDLWLSWCLPFSLVSVQSTILQYQKL